MKMEALKAWVARDENGDIYLYLSKPLKFEGRWIQTSHRLTIMEKESFPQVKWEDEEPTEVSITVKKKLKHNG